MPHIFSTIIEQGTWFWLNRKIQISRMFFTSPTSFYFRDESSDGSRYWVHEMGMKWIFQGCQTEASQSKSDMYRQKYSDMLNISIRQSVQSFRILLDSGKEKVMAKNVSLSGFGIWPWLWSWSSLYAKTKTFEPSFYCFVKSSSWSRSFGRLIR